ncbi:hypothetical protein M9H77_11334 [Catharanthus roseus]|uniref:Uncharacterized protein n=1 Tax=Catharanthus roseus TaxID=4058 RepID=A0ACC0BE78_CATRO|nr:hypothetical protein M9H77_11334 [Catharanthus roseus]
MLRKQKRFQNSLPTKTATVDLAVNNSNKETRTGNKRKGLEIFLSVRSRVDLTPSEAGIKPKLLQFTVFGFSDSRVPIQVSNEQELGRNNGKREKVGSFLPRDPSDLGFGHHGWKTNELREFGLTVHETVCPTCPSGEERDESLSSRWPF